MKLQLQKGSAWKTILLFPASRNPEVEDAAASLSRAAGGLPMRIVDINNNKRYLNENGVFRSRGEGAKQ